MANVRRTSNTTRFDTVTKKPNRFAASLGMVTEAEPEPVVDNSFVEPENASEPEVVEHKEIDEVPKKSKPAASSKPKPEKKVEEEPAPVHKPLFVTKQKKKGVQKTVYFDGEVYEKVENIEKETGLKFSNVLHELLVLALDLIEK